MNAMHDPIKRLALAAVGGVTALALLGPLPAAAGHDDDGFHATGRPKATNVFVGPDGPTRFTDEVRVKFEYKTDRNRTKVIRLNHPGGIATATFELEPGASFPWHVHPGPVLVSVIGGGEISLMRASDCAVRPYPAGTVYLEPGPVHTAFNQGTETVTVVGTFFDVASGEAIATPVSPRTQLRLDKKCGIDTVLP